MKNMYFVSIIFILFLLIGCGNNQPTNTEVLKADTLNTVVDSTSVDTLK